jgi:hypothetical protein
MKEITVSMLLNQTFQSWAALYAAGLGAGGEPKVESERLTPRGVMDMCAAVSASGDLRRGHARRRRRDGCGRGGVVDMCPAMSSSSDLLAVASYCDWLWAFEFQALETEVAMFREANPSCSAVVAARARIET